MANPDDLERMKKQVEEGLRLFEEWPRKHLSLQDTAFPEEALCSICYLSGLADGKPEQGKHAVVVLCPSPSGYVQIYEWDGGPTSGVLKATRKYACDSTAVESTVKGLVDSFLRQPAVVMELIAVLREAQDAIDLLFARLAFADKDFRPSESGQPWEAMKALAKAVAHAKQKGPQYPCPNCGVESEFAGLSEDYPTFKCESGHYWHAVVEVTNGHVGEQHES
ncbi:hypothetical protein LCGC14_2447060 [marine sediment metagenome]|uniref:Uncharacterized protein n=1 Tax=marine sediment metagenome TaxID=412755 RepID=A0A0F9EB51_9ZZZZ